MIRKETFIIIIVTFITIVAWAVFDIVHKRSVTTTSPKLQQVSEPLDPNFDQEAIKLLP